ncbi:MAG TPA: hypothetical protein VFA65_07205 [Bryobacteraceae bacterium]|nr:hypothetical protein [Bryobacteraceae bacterium]
MTKVQCTFKLSRELNDEELKKISRIHAVYGILAVRLMPAEQLFIEYDASRLTPKEVEGTLDENGIPLA